MITWSTLMSTNLPLNLANHQKLRSVDAFNLSERRDQQENFDDYINNLYNRIVGNSLAFEGIRLVKERIR